MVEKTKTMIIINSFGGVRLLRLASQLPSLITETTYPTKVRKTPDPKYLGNIFVSFISFCKFCSSFSSLFFESGVILFFSPSNFSIWRCNLLALSSKIYSLFKTINYLYLIVSLLARQRAQIAEVVKRLDNRSLNPIYVELAFFSKIPRGKILPWGSKRLGGGWVWQRGL